MTRLECKRCAEVVEYTGRTVKLPFYCSDCAPIALPERPKRTAKLKVAKCADAACVCQDGRYDVAPRTATEPVSCDSATVEATTELISDLEEQLRRSQELNADYESQTSLSSEVISDLKTQLANALKTSEFKNSERLGIENFALKSEIAGLYAKAISDSELMNEAADEIEKQEREIKTLIAVAERKNKQLSYALEVARRDAVYYRSRSFKNEQANLEKRREIEDLKERGLISRIFRRGE